MFKIEPYDDYEVEDDFQLELPVDRFSLNPQAPTFIPKEQPLFKHFRHPFDGRLPYGPPYDFGVYHNFHDFCHHNHHHPPHGHHPHPCEIFPDPRDVYYGWYGNSGVYDGYYEHPHHKQYYEQPNKRLGKQRKYSYRSKQNKINIVLHSLKRKFSENGKLAHGEVLRGADTLRIDVKRFTALQQIEKVIGDIERSPNFDIIKVDFPVSQKNRFQKKGFIAYLKCGSAEQAHLLHDELTGLVDPKWQNKNLFRINIALDQQRDYDEFEYNTYDSRSRKSSMGSGENVKNQWNRSEQDRFTRTFGKLNISPRQRMNSGKFTVLPHGRRV